MRLYSSQILSHQCYHHQAKGIASFIFYSFRKLAILPCSMHVLTRPTARQQCGFTDIGQKPTKVSQMSAALIQGDGVPAVRNERVHRMLWRMQTRQRVSAHLYSNIKNRNRKTQKKRTTSAVKSYRKEWLPLVRSMAVFSLHEGQKYHQLHSRKKKPRNFRQLVLPHLPLIQSH